MTEDWRKCCWVGTAGINGEGGTLTQCNLFFEMQQTHLNSCDPKWLPEYSLLPSGDLASKFGQGQPLKRPAADNSTS